MDQRVAIIAWGSRGDVQPFIALALELKKSGANVKLCLGADMQFLCTPFLSPEDCCLMPNVLMQDFIKNDPMAREAMAKGSFMKFLKVAESPPLLKGMVADGKFLLREMIAFDPHLVVYASTCSPFGLVIAQALKIPSVYMSMQMMIEGSSIELPGMLGISQKVARRLPSCAVSLIWRMLFKLISSSKGFTVFDREMRCKCIRGAKPLTTSQKIDLIRGRSEGCTRMVALSPTLTPPPADWTEQSKNCFIGSMILSSRLQVQAWPPSQELKAFLDKENHEAAPVYFGWGSMIAWSPTYMVELAVRTLKAVGRRGIILAGWAELRLELLEQSNSADAAELHEFATQNVHFLTDESAPHEWLFPQMEVIVHHGGAGTSASAMRSGKPSIITPCFADQPELAQKIERVGGGIGLKQFHCVKLSDLVDAVARAICDPELRASASRLGDILRNECGAAKAAAHIMLRCCEAEERVNLSVKPHVHIADSTGTRKSALRQSGTKLLAEADSMYSENYISV